MTFPVALLLALLTFVIGLVVALALRARPQAALAAQNREWQERVQEQALELARQQERLLALTEQDGRAREAHARLVEEMHGLQRAVQERDQRLAEAGARLRAEQEKLTAQAEFIRAQEQSLKLQFEQLATRIFDEKSQKFSEQNKSGMDGLLNPLREQLKDFREKVENAYSNEARERFALKEQIARLEGLNRQISDDASNLARALKGDKKLQGNWGEVILARVLEESGLRAGHEYITQFSVVSEDGKRRIPDAIIRLPENRDIIVDSKVSLNDYVAYCASEDAEERERLLKAHAVALRNHVRALSEKRYEDLPELRTLDFVFLFMPVEAAFMLAVEADPELFREAFDRKIVIVSPTTLLATLRTVESIWRYERQNVNAEKIAKEAGLLHDKFVVLTNHLDDLGRALERSQESYRKTQASLSGHGGLVGKVDNLRRLGARTKKTLAAASGSALTAADLADDDAVFDEPDTESAE
ncbi:MAG TPA: DNA recombination protein RmuC [Moraxellaceae bacterium]|nr:DNA recombination protein RmuC [Moraxellaceae bacterium]